MHAGNTMHVTGARVSIRSSVANMLQRPLGVAHCFEVEAGIEFCKELPLWLGAAGPEHLLDGEISSKHLVYLAHGNARIRPDREKRGFRFARRFPACHTKEMPRCIFDIVWIHCAVRLELRSTILEAPGVVERDTPLPELRQCVRRDFDQPIEPCNRFLDSAALEIRHSTVKNRPRLF